MLGRQDPKRIRLARTEVLGDLSVADGGRVPGSPTFSGRSRPGMQSAEGEGESTFY